MNNFILGKLIYGHLITSSCLLRCWWQMSDISTWSAAFYSAGPCLRSVIRSVIRKVWYLGMWSKNHTFNHTLINFSGNYSQPTFLNSHLIKPKATGLLVIRLWVLTLVKQSLLLLRYSGTDNVQRSIENMTIKNRIS